MSNDTKGNLDWGMTAALRLPIGEEIEGNLRSPFKLDETPFPDSDVSGRLGILVERRHEIMVEKSQEISGVNVEILRGN